MNKTSIKIIKRKDAEAMANDRTQDLSEPKLVATMSGEKIERRLHCMMADTVSNWIAECRENNRVEEVSAIRRMFGSESFMSKAA
ncbi:MAG: hypothetical protein ACR2M8_04155 [Pyrinomonadaceae bacterium]|nr:hypothetical protein [Acidobacteriota bacterium]